ncbi:DUF305 domain-containing protein [Streptomyces sp. NPDC093085]|uniref:DUF305 domain-containing protein n=1 Tax=Streptomyces sp. NPDC093085 TaxID=3155068 RepID=UPI00343AC242
MTSYRSRSPRRRGAVAAAVTVSAVLLLAGCGGQDSSGGAAPSASASAAGSRHNAADVTFAQAMIPHHRQAVEMAELAPDRASSDAVLTLASEIRKAQDPEIKTLSGWLKSWGEEAPERENTEQAGPSGHDGHSMAGMMTGDDMAELAKAEGAAFDTAFLTMMVAHHEGAVDMAEAESSQGVHDGARKLARAIITTQSAEIARMNSLLGKESKENPAGQ